MQVRGLLLPSAHMNNIQAITGAEFAREIDPNFRASTKYINVLCVNESGRLRDVILGKYDNFHADPTTVEVVNEAQAKSYESNSKPTAATLAPEFNNLTRVLEANGVRVRLPMPTNVPDQLTPRDIGFTIGDTFFVANMARKSRKTEFQGILGIIGAMPKVIQVPANIIIEGGDIVVDKGKVFVGISQRTTLAGVDFLRSVLETQYSIEPVHLKSLEEGEDCLHLDCAFVPVGERHALIYEDGINHISDSIRHNYEWIPVTKTEQAELATNVLSISPKLVISRDIATRINTILEAIGINVLPLQFNEAPKTGGSFRCCTLPLYRDSN